MGGGGSKGGQGGGTSGKGGKSGGAGGKGGKAGGKGGNNRNVETVDINNIPETNPDYPPPYVPETYKEEIFTESIVNDIKVKIKEMPTTAEGSYSTLLNKLSTMADTEVQFVIAVYLWMKEQDYFSSTLDMVKAGDTPKGYMKMIKDGTGDLMSFFTILCRRAGIPCVIMEGIGKGENYSVGDPEKSLRTKWNIVYADDEWHFVHIDWCMSADINNEQNENSKQGSDYFFLTNPDEFAQFCFPDNYQWQLLDRPTDKKGFLSQPNCRPKFWELDGTVETPRTSAFKAMNGKANIELTFPKARMGQINLSYLLSYIDKPNEDDETTNMLNNLQKLVVLYRKPAKFVFELILPVPGKYIFDIFGEIEQPKEKESNEEDETKNTKTEVEKLCQFKLTSDKTFDPDDLELLPESPVYGWGPGPHCKALGLVPKSHHEGVIYIKPGEVRNVQFKMKRELDVTCQLTHNFLPVYELVEQVECTTDDHEANIRVQVPEEGQYGLKIYCREAGSKGYNEACVYLIKQRTKGRLPEKYRDRMIRSRLEHHIVNHTSEQALEDAIEVFKCYNVPDNGELQRADDKLKQYWKTKRELRGILFGRNMNVNHKWLDQANHSKYKDDLQEEIRKAQRMENNLKRRKGNPHPISKMDPESTIEIRNYKRPQRVVHDVMASTYILLGEKKSDVEDWEQIQYLMHKTGKDGLQKRVVARRAEDIPIESAMEADAMIEPYDLQKCRAVSNGICSYYKWDKQIIGEVKKLDEEARERYEREHPTVADDDLGSNVDGDNDTRPGSKHSRSPSQHSNHSNDSQKGRNNEDADDHPFAVKQNHIKPPPSIAASKPTPSEQKNDNPVEYAGFKPQGI
ncbi:hypothetical protein ACF0H5_012954 [Mactra antiquata]